MNDDLLRAAADEAGVEAAWNDFQGFMEANGIAEIKQTMKDRYVKNLKNYQANGFFTDVVVD